MSPFPNADQDPFCEGNPSQTLRETSRHLVGINGYPTSHRLLSTDLLGDLSQWIDNELEQLQQKHRAFITRSSLRKDLGRR